VGQYPACRPVRRYGGRGLPRLGSLRRSGGHLLAVPRKPGKGHWARGAGRTGGPTAFAGRGRGGHCPAGNLAPYAPVRIKGRTVMRPWQFRGARRCAQGRTYMRSGAHAGALRGARRCTQTRTKNKHQGTNTKEQARRGRGGFHPGRTGYTRVSAGMGKLGKLSPQATPEHPSRHPPRSTRQTRQTRPGRGSGRN